MKYCLALLTLAIAATVFAEEAEITEQQRAAMKQAAEFRTFTTTNGVSITGRPVDYRESTGIVELLTSDGSEKVELATLSESAQTYIQDWYTAHAMLNKIKISLHEDEDLQNVATNSISPYYHEYLSYEFSMENKNREALNSLLIAYCIYTENFIESSVQEGWFTYGTAAQGGGFSPTGPVIENPDETSLIKTKGYLLITKIDRREKMKMKTSSVRIYNGKLEARVKEGAFKSGRVKTVKTKEEGETDILGIRYRIFLPTPNGNYAMMEFADPKSLLEETEWPEEL